jgi:hypothetical protein
MKIVVESQGLSYITLTKVRLIRNSFFYDPNLIDSNLIESNRGVLMNIKRNYSVFILTLGLVLVSGVCNATDVYARKTTTTISLNSGSGVATTLLTVNIPAGIWKVTAKSSVVNFGNGDFMRCIVTSGLTQIDSATSFAGSSTGQPAVVTITNVGVINTTITSAFALKCQHDASAAGIYVDPDAKLIVERVSSGLSNL